MRTEKYRELAWELRNEIVIATRWAVYIDGRYWKTLDGKEYNIKEMCKRKTADTGKEWKVEAVPVYAS
jgi:hypothetical protein